MTKPPVLTDEPQVFLATPRQFYDDLEAINNSLLKAVNGATPLHGWAAYLDPEREPQEDNPAFRIGTLVHMLLLEPDEFAKVETSDASSTTKAFKAAQEDAAERGVELYQQKEYDKALAIGQAVLKHSGLAPLFQSDDPAEADLQRQLNEVTLTWLDPETKTRCKARLDAVRFVGPSIKILDLKTAASAASEDFGKAAVNYGYLQQGAFYSDALFHCKKALAEALGLDPRPLIGAGIEFEFVVPEKPRPMASLVARYYMDSDHFKIGRQQYRKALNSVAQCVKTGYWPGYRVDAQPLELPRWFRP